MLIELDDCFINLENVTYFKKDSLTTTKIFFAGGPPIVVKIGIEDLKELIRDGI